MIEPDPMAELRKAVADKHAADDALRARRAENVRRYLEAEAARRAAVK